MGPRVLFVVSQEPNQGDIYFAGMRQLVGNNCVEFPFKPMYHLRREGGRLFYGDSRQKVIEEDSHGFLHDRRFGWMAPRYFGFQDPTPYELVENRLDLSRFDVIIISFLRTNRRLAQELLMMNERTSGLPVIYLDGEDDPLIRGIYFRTDVRTYFKREVLSKIPLDAFYLRRLFGAYLLTMKDRGLASIDSCLFPSNLLAGHLSSLALTSPEADSRTSKTEKVYDVSFVAALTNPKRVRLFEFLTRYASKKRLKCYLRLLRSKDEPIPLDEYLDIIRKSKLAVSAPGAGFDTYRYWEIPSNGSALVSERPFIRIKRNFIDGESAILYRDLQELESKLTRCLASDSWQDISNKGQEHFRSHHTYLSRASQLLDRASSVVPG